MLSTRSVIPATSKLAKNHSYVIVGMKGDTVTLYNPWGHDDVGFHDGDPSDGLVSVSASEFNSVVERYACASF